MKAESVDYKSSEEGLMCDALLDTVVKSQLQMRDTLDEIEDVIQQCAVDRSSTLPFGPTHEQEEDTPRHCVDLYKAGHNESGVYNVNVYIAGYPVPVPVYCDMETDGGGWLTSWSMSLHFTVQQYQHLRVDLRDHEGHIAYAEYDYFYIDPQVSEYVLKVSTYEGNAGDSLTSHSSMKFSTKDMDNDAAPRSSCALLCNGGWWYNDCHQSNLNQANLNSLWVQTGQHNGRNRDRYMHWKTWRGLNYSLLFSEMKIRPDDFIAFNYQLQ